MNRNKYGFSNAIWVYKGDWYEVYSNYDQCSKPEQNLKWSKTVVLSPKVEEKNNNEKLAKSRNFKGKNFFTRSILF